MDLIENVTGGSKRLDQYRRKIVNRIGDTNKVASGKREKLCKSAVAIVYPQNSSCRTVTRVSCAAESALAAPDVDFARNATPDQRSIRGFDNATDELMSGRAVKARVAFENFKVGVADARAYHLDQSFALATRNLCVAH